jgi:transposase, IS5 family
MRVPFLAATQLDSLPINQIVFNANCRDAIIPILVSLQLIYSRPERDSILELITQDVNPASSPDHGRLGMTYWQILVLVAVRLGCNCDYDHLQDLAENHRTLRRMMEIGSWDDEHPTPWDWRRIRDNLCKLSPKTVAKINQHVVAVGHDLEPSAVESVRGDTFVVETNIHYPTDASLLADGVRILLRQGKKLAKLLLLKGFRQATHLHARARKLLRTINQACKSKQAGAPQRRQAAYRPLLKLVNKLLRKCRQAASTAAGTLTENPHAPGAVEATAVLAELRKFIGLTEKVLSCAERRVLRGETVPNADKIFSLFEAHTELIRRGKTPNPIQFGHRVMVWEDRLGFIVHYEVVANGVVDSDNGQQSLATAQAKMAGKIKEASLDRGFDSPANREELPKLVEEICMPIRGYKQAEEQEAEATERFRKLRRHHAGIESAINALEFSNGLERCRDKTEIGYERYVGIAILGRNLHVLGKLILSKLNPGSQAGSSRRKQD